MSRARYPAPDRSNFQTNQYRADANLPEGDIGAFTGEFADGRPFRVESWYTEGLTLITCFFSTDELEEAPPDKLLEYVRPILEDAEVPEKHRRLSASAVRTIDDASGHRMFSLTFVVGEPH